MEVTFSSSSKDPAVTEPLAPQLADILAQSVPGAPPLGLRARKKAAAMRRIQEVAVAQFEEHGYEAVTIEDIAAHAEVSASSVYRYFGTKEGLILHDEYDDLLRALAPRLFAEDDPWTSFAQALRQIADTHIAQDPLALRRMHLWHETPAVRETGLVVFEQTARDLAPFMHAADRYGLTLHDYQVISSSIMAAFFVALEKWYDDGGDGDLVGLAIKALELIRPAWADQEAPPPAVDHPAGQTAH